MGRHFIDMPDDPVIIEVRSPFDAAENARIINAVRSSDPGSPVIVDVRSVDRLEDHLLVELAEVIVSREASGSFVGLPQHHMRIMQYVGVASKLR